VPRLGALEDTMTTEQKIIRAGLHNTSALASSRVRYSLRAVRSVLSDEKKLSIAALSQTLPDSSSRR
jgi:hypothetical protein